MQELISSLDERRIELALLAIVMLLREDTEATSSPNGVKQSLPFVPHMPHACWVNVFGKANVVKEHLRAIVALVHRAGGLDNVSSDVQRELRL